MVATYRSSDASPKERFVHQQAGDGGFGGSSYIDLLAFREKDANTAWTSASDGTLEERLYYCQNQHADVVALITAAGTQREMDRYSAYGVPFGLPVGDCDSDGDCGIGERSLVQAWITGSAYDVRGDIDLDGDVDSTDKDAVRDNWEGVTLGRGVLSAGAVGSRRGVAGYEISTNVSGPVYQVRNRVLDSGFGRWLRRDPLGYSDGTGLYEYGLSNAVSNSDESGLKVSVSREMEHIHWLLLDCCPRYKQIMDTLAARTQEYKLEEGPVADPNIGQNECDSTGGSTMTVDFDKHAKQGQSPTATTAHEAFHALHCQTPTNRVTSWIEELLAEAVAKECCQTCGCGG